MDRPAELGQLKSGEWGQLQDLVDRFERACHEAGPRADLINLADYLPPKGDPLRTVTLHELIKTDLEIRWRRGQTVPIERYVERFPEMGTVRELPAALIFEEYCVRQRYGDKPELGVYRGRFPEQFEAVQRLAHEQPIQTLATPAHTSPTAVSPAAPAKSSKPSAPSLPAASSAAGLQAFGNYQKVKRIGSGSFGEVYRAIAPGGIEVALKVINRPVDHEEAQRELQSLEQVKLLRHPYLLQTQAFFLEEDRLYIVMELADDSLRGRLKECRAEGKRGIPVAELIRYFRESAEALDFLHAQHRMHRDIKPENILILQRHAKVADFGLARMMESQRMVTATSSGTPAYMAPEVWRGKVSKNSDQYSLAATYAELRLDRSLIPSRDMMEVMLFHIERQPDLDPLPKAEQEVLLKALSKNPEDRYPSCSDFVAALETAVAAELGRTHLGSSLGSGLPAAAASGTVTNLGTLRPGEAAATLGQGAQGTQGHAPWQTVGAPPARGSGWAVKVLVGLIVFLLVGAGSWFVITGGDISSITQSKPQRQVGQLIKEKHFADAVEAVEKADLDPGGKTSLLGKVTQAWLREADDLKNRGNNEQAYNEYSRIYERFSDRPEVSQSCREALEQIIPVLVGEWQAVGRFDDALALLRKPPGDQLSQKDQLQQEVLNAWLSKGEGELAAQEFASAEKIAQDILDRFRGNGSATRLRKEAIAGSATQAINSNRFSGAFVILSGRGQILDATLKKKLQEDLRTAWRKQVDQEVNADRVIALAGDFLNAFPGDRKVMEKRDAARARKAVKSIEDLQKAEDFRGAIKAFRANEGLFKDEKAKGELKTSLRKAWLAYATKLAEKDKILAVAEIDEFRNVPDNDFRDDPDADKLHGKLRPASSGGDRAAIVKSLEEGDARLTDGDDKKDAKQYEQAADWFDQALKAPGIAEARDLRLRALRGQARAHARMNQWNLLQQNLEALGKFEEKALDSRTRAYRLALPILAAFAANQKVSATERLAQLAGLKSEDREYLGKWEQDRLKEVFNSVVRGLELGNKDPKEALPLIEQLLAFDPQHLATLMLKAELLYSKGDWQASDEAVTAAENQLGPNQGKERQDLAALKALITLKVAKDPSSPSERKNAAVTLLKQVLAPGRPRLSDLAKEYADFAVRNRGYRRQTIAGLKAALEQLPEGDKKDLLPVYRGLAVLHCKDLLADADKLIDNNDRVNADKQLKAAEEYALDDAATQGQVRALRAYVKALDLQEAQDVAAAADGLVAVDATALIQALKAKHRDQAALILQDAAKKGRIPADEKKPLQKPFASEQDADKAFQWLDRARQLLGGTKENVPAELLKNLVLAAGFGSKKDDSVTVIKLAGAIPAKESETIRLGPDGVAFLLAQSRARAASKQAQDIAEGVRGYAAILDLSSVQSKIRFAADDFALDFHEQVLKPGIRSGASLYESKKDENLGKNLARLYAMRGRLIADAPQIKWTFADPKQVMIESFDKAIDCDPRAEYFARRGLARAQLPDLLKNLNLIKEDANAALKLDDKLPSANGLLGFVLYVQAASAADREQKLKDFDAAAAAFKTGIDQCRRPQGDPENDLPILLTNRSQALVQLAHLDRTKRKTHLLAASQDARDATKLPHRNPQNAFQALGNSLEDLAWLGGESKYYGEAVTAFEDAADRADGQNRFRIALARCRYKWVAYGDGPATTTLPPAVKALELVCGRKPKPAEEAEARYWLANVYRLMGNTGKAEESFQRVADVLAKLLSGPAQDWERLATRDFAFFLLDDAEQKPVKNRKDRLELAGDLAERIRKYSGSYAADPARILGRALELEEKPEAALAAYESYKPQRFESDCRLTLARLDCLLRWRRQLKPDLAKVVSEADEAVKFAQDPAFYDPALRAAALATAASARVASANDSDANQEQELRTAALEKYREAILQVPAYHPGYWRWRYDAARQLKQLMEGPGVNAAKKKELASEAVGYLNKAIDKAPTSEKDRYTALRREVDASKE